MRSLVVATVVLIVSPDAPAPPGLYRQVQGPDDSGPPLGCRHAFPPHAWCLEQEAAAEAFCRKCKRMIAASRNAEEKRRWEVLEEKAALAGTAWWALSRVQDGSPNGPDETTRRGWFHSLYKYLGPDGVSPCQPRLRRLESGG